MEIDPAELLALEREPRKPPTKTSAKPSGKPRDELGRFTRVEKRAA